MLVHGAAGACPRLHDFTGGAAAFRCFELQLLATASGEPQAVNPGAAFSVELQEQARPGVWVRALEARGEQLEGSGGVGDNACRIDNLDRGPCLVRVRLSVQGTRPAGDYRVVVREYEPHPPVNAVGWHPGLEVYMDSVALG